jgi:hypothetical protein
MLHDGAAFGYSPGELANYQHFCLRNSVICVV